MDPERERLWKKYDDIGVDEVRTRLELGRISGSNATFARAWLAKHERGEGELRDERDTRRFWVAIIAGIIGAGIGAAATIVPGYLSGSFQQICP